MSTKTEMRAKLDYASETNVRMNGLKTRMQNAKHFIRRRDPAHAVHELVGLADEANRLALHLEAWGSYNEQPSKETP